jgi:cell division protein FtsN
MHGVFDQEEHPPIQRRQDTELTLGPLMLLAIFFGLVLLCGLCFGLGYSMGHRGPQTASSAGAEPAAGGSQPASSSPPKPSATAPVPPQPAERTVVDLPPSEPDTNGQAANAGNPGSSSGPNSASRPVVKPALPPASTVPAPAQTASALPSPAAKPVPPAALMVQIAAVTHAEDAEVLVGALRKRGYAVTVGRQPADTLIHVRIGPFATRDEANRWRQKLLNDGYNAVLQP